MRKQSTVRADRLDAVFVALADPTRRAIIECLSRGEARVTDVAEPFDMTLYAVSKHIRVLEAGGIVGRRRKGREHIISVIPQSLDEADAWIAQTRRFWEQRLDAMERLLRDVRRGRALAGEEKKA